MRVMQLSGSGPPEHGRPCVAVRGAGVCARTARVPLESRLGLRLRLCTGANYALSLRVWPYRNRIMAEIWYTYTRTR